MWVSFKCFKAYNYVTEYVLSSQNTADFLSRSVASHTMDTNEIGKVDNTSNSRGASAVYRSNSATYMNCVWQPQMPPMVVKDRPTGYLIK